MLLQCLFIGCFAQTGTIRVKKVGGCDFELIVDSSLIDKACKISGVSVSGTDDMLMLKNLNYFSSQEILVSKKTFENDLKDVCDTKEYILEKIEVKGKDPNNIYISISFLRKSNPQLFNFPIFNFSIFQPFPSTTQYPAPFVYSANAT